MSRRLTSSILRAEIEAGFDMKICAAAAAFCLSLTAGRALADGYANFNAGVAAAQRFDTLDAIKSLSAALATADLPSHLRPTAYAARGQEYMEQKNYDAALADFSDALRLKPDAIYYVQRSVVRRKKRQLDEALADCNSAIALQPNNWRLHSLRIGLLVDAKRFDDASAEYTAFMTKRPDDLLFLLGRAEVFRAAGQYQKALADAEAARQQNTQWGAPYLTLGTIHMAQGDLSQALDNFDTYAFWDRNPAAPIMKGEVQWALGRFDAAQSSFEASLDRYRTQPYSLLWLTLTAVRLGREPREKYTAPFFDIDLTSWPGPLVSLYIGKSTPEAVLKVRDEMDKSDDNRCEADFFVGEWQQTHGDQKDGRSLLQEASSACERDWQTRKLATIDLARVP